MSLIQKLTEKLKNMNENTKKRIIAMALAGTMAISTGIGLAGCGTNTDPNTEPGTTITDPSGDTNTDENGNNNTEDNKYSKYSSILQKVLTDDYYVQLEQTNRFDSTKKRAYNNNQFMAIPYGFLEEEGYNINDIKNNNLYAYATLYLINNDLFIELRAETKTNTKFYEEYSSYCTNYLLKYNLTNQELKELKSLHSDLTKSEAGKKHTFIQAPLFVQALSYEKTPEVISKNYVILDSLEATEEKCNDKNYFNSNTLVMTYLGATKINDYTYGLKYQAHPNTNKYTCRNTNLYTMTFEGYGSSGEVPFDEKNIQMNDNKSIYSLNGEEVTNIKENSQPITVLSSYYSYFKSINYDANIENVI